MWKFMQVETTLFDLNKLSLPHSLNLRIKNWLMCVRKCMRMEKIDVTMNKTLSATNTSHLERKKGAQKRKKTLQIKL